MATRPVATISFPIFRVPSGLKRFEKALPSEDFRALLSSAITDRIRATSARRSGSSARAIKVAVAAINTDMRVRWCSISLDNALCAGFLSRNIKWMIMEHELEHTISLLTRTPAALNALLRDLPEMWTIRNEGEGTWSATEVVGHLIHADRTDWIPRARIVLKYGEAQAFESFDSTPRRRSMTTCSGASQTPSRPEKAWCGLWQRKPEDSTVNYAIRAKTGHTSSPYWTGSACNAALRNLWHHRLRLRFFVLMRNGGSK